MPRRWHCARCATSSAGRTGPMPPAWALSEGDAEAAESAFRASVAHDPLDARAIWGLVRALLHQSDLEKARAVLEGFRGGSDNASIKAARAAVDLAEQASALGGVNDLKNKIAASPENVAIRFDLAVALNAESKRAEAADELLEIIRRDRTWNEDGARKQLVQFFEAWGPMDAATIAARRKLSAILFS